MRTQKFDADVYFMESHTYGRDGEGENFNS